MPEARDDAPELFHSIAADDEDFQRACTVVAAGSAIACCVAILNCRPPTFPTLTWAAVVLRSAQYLAATAVAGAIGLAIACHTLAQRPQVRRRRLVEHALMGWLFLPGIVLLDRSWPAWALPLFALAAAGMAVSLQLLSPRDFNEADPTLQPRDFATFYGTPITGFRPARAVTISLCAEGALALTGAESYRLAGLLLGAAMFLLLWHWSAEVQIQLRPHQRRLLATGVAGLSFLICLLVLMPWIRRYGEGIPVSAKTNMPAIAPPMPARAPFGSVILYPPAERVTRLYLPAPNALANLSRITKPLEIPFDGAYWYFESPDAGSRTLPTHSPRPPHRCSHQYGVGRWRTPPHAGGAAPRAPHSLQLLLGPASRGNGRRSSGRRDPGGHRVDRHCLAEGDVRLARLPNRSRHRIDDLRHTARPRQQLADRLGPFPPAARAPHAQVQPHHRDDRAHHRPLPWSQSSSQGIHPTAKVVFALLEFLPPLSSPALHRRPTSWLQIPYS